jgi:pimeloyl-ACP methyl ester carboxylesterase
MDNLKNIYILHGWAYSTEKWNPLISLLENNKIKVHLLKIPGLTDSLTTPWTIDDYVNWLYKILEKEKNRVTILGHSNGGRIAMNFAIKYPDKLSELILIDSAGITHNELRLRLKRRFFSKVAKIGKKYIYSESLRKALYKFTAERDYSEANPLMRKIMLNLIDSDKLLQPEKILTRTTIIWGEKDSITPLKDGVNLAKKIKNSTLHIIKNARHSPQFTHPQQIYKIISEALEIR